MSASALLPHIDAVVWLVAGLALCAAETIAPGAFLIWIGVAAVLLGAVDFLWPLGFEAQLLVFAALALALVVLGRRIYGSMERHAPVPPLGRADALIGKDFYLEKPIVHGFGSIRVDDSVWRVAGEDMGAGSRVRVTGVEEGVLLRVAKA